MVKKPVRPAAVKTEAAPSGSPFIASCGADAKRFSASVASGSPTREDLTAAVGYWTGYPLLLEGINGASWTASYKCTARNSLGSAHYAATNVLMHEAARQGLDPHALYSCAQTIRGIYRENPKRTRDPATLEWLDGAKLPDHQRAALRDGEAVFIRLCVALDLKAEARPAAGEPVKPPAGKPKRGGQARISEGEREGYVARRCPFYPEGEKLRLLKAKGLDRMKVGKRTLNEASRRSQSAALAREGCRWDHRRRGWWDTNGK